MTSKPNAKAGTALSPEWDRGFDEAFTELITSDPELVRTEFDALIDAAFYEPPPPPPPPAPPVPSGSEPQRPHPGPTPTPVTQAAEPGPARDAAGPSPRSPP